MNTHIIISGSKVTIEACGASVEDATNAQLHEAFMEIHRIYAILGDMVKAIQIEQGLRLDAMVECRETALRSLDKKGQD